MIAEQWPTVGFATLLFAIWTRAHGRAYVHRTRRGRWAYGLRDAGIRWHVGTADTWVEAMRRVTGGVQ